MTVETETLRKNIFRSIKKSGFYRVEKIAHKTVSVEIASVIQQTKTSWQVDWTETERDRQGQPIQPPAKMRALVTIRVAPPSSATTEEQIKQNPLGVFVQDFSWSRTL